MSEHLSNALLSALVDGELAGDELTPVEAHLAECPDCTRRALSESLLKRAAVRAGQRYELPEGLRERVRESLESHPSGAWVGHPASAAGTREDKYRGPSPASRRQDDGIGDRSRWAWLAVAAAVLVCVSAFVARDASLRGAQQSALVNEAVDEHIAAMAAGGPEVVSSDRHTVKPWFQGKLPFSFNLPQELPTDVTLDGANLVQVEGRPAAQLLFSIGKHRASVFVRQIRGGTKQNRPVFPHDRSVRIPSLEVERDGFRIEGFETAELNVVVVSDADPARLAGLFYAMAAAQQ
jgi:anti-sigma factor RsiW